MEKTLNKIKNFFLNHWILIASVLIFLSLTFPAIFDKDHFLYNLEPYPDGIAYVLSAKNFVKSGELLLKNDLSFIKLWVPPLYSYVLAIGFLFSQNTASFYIVNLLLQIGTIFLIYSILKKTIKQNWVIASSLAIYLSHLVVFWLPMTPMSENLLLLFFTLLLRALVEKSVKKRFLLGTIALVGLLLVKFSVIFTVLAGAILLIYPYLKNKHNLLNLSIVTLLILGFIFRKLLISRGLNIQNVNFQSLTQKSGEFFSIFYFVGNTKEYLKSFAFQQGNFLWLKLGVSSLGVFGMYVYSLAKLFKIKKNLFFINFSLFISQFPILLLFYTVDSRYLILSLPLLAIGVAWGLEEFESRKEKIVFILILSIFLNLILQKNILKEIISYNLLGKSTAWQYVASKEVTSNLGSEDFLITALPPFLVDNYKTSNVELLPLSKNQEFVSRNNLLWKRNLNYENLEKSYKKMIENKKNIYITNAYITHQHSVVDDYERYKKYFDFELISEGCSQACNLFKLSIKQ